MVICFSWPLSSVVIDDFYLALVSTVPAENDSPLVIDADAPESLEITLQRFEAIGWRNPKVSQFSGLVQHPQFSACAVLNVARQLSGPITFENLLSLRITERFNHVRNDKRTLGLRQA